VNLGLIALTSLRQARKDENKEVVRRATECTKRIEKDSEVNLPLAVVRLLARRKPAELLETFLRFLPFTIDEKIEEEIYYALEAEATKVGKVHGALVKALKDELPARRAVAGCLLGRLGDEKQRKAVRNLLSDREPMVRLRSAQGLLAGKDKEAIPTLIGLLNGATVAVSWQAEELLHYVAGDETPTATIGSPRAQRAPVLRAIRA
jgi:HEAT repeat protein